MPDVRDIKKIERIIGEVGEQELEIGELPEKETGEAPKGEEFPEGGQGEEFGEPSAGEAPPPEGEAGEKPGAVEVGEDLTTLLKDIEIGLTEEKELEEKLVREGEGEEIVEGRPEEIGFEEGPEGIAGGVEAGIPSELSAGEELGEEPGEFPSEEEGGFDLPLDFDMEKLAVPEEPSEELLLSAEDTKGKEKPGKKERGPGPREPGSLKETQPKEKPQRGTLEELEKELMEVEKGAAEQEIPKGIPEEAPLEGVLHAEEAAEEEFELPDLEEAGEPEKEISIPGLEVSDLTVGDRQVSGMGVPEFEGTFTPEAEVPKTRAPEEIIPDIEIPRQKLPREETLETEGEIPSGGIPEMGVFEFPELEEGAPEEGFPGAGLPSDEKAVEEGEAPEGEEEFVLPEELGAEPVEEALFESAEAEGALPPEEEVPGEAGGEEIEPPARAPAGIPAGDVDIELTDEDIVLIKTKLKQLAPPVASRVREVIVDATLPADSMRGLLNLLIQDAPEEEIVQYVEWATGKKLVPRKRAPIVPALPRPRPFEALAENIGPLIRVGGLFAAILVIFGALFVVFVYRPLQANKYYREGITQIKQENYQEAEESFKKAVSKYEKIKEYDNFGWEYMLTGNYDAAEQKFTAGIEREQQKYGRVQNINLRIHRAKLYNILERYPEADKDYDVLIKVMPTSYAYKGLKGQNLIDWGKKSPEQLEKAYTLYREEYAKNEKNSDPIFQMLAIELLEKNDKNIKYYHSLLEHKFPQAVHRVVHTELAYYLISKNEIDEVWKTLSSVIRRYPDYPRAYYNLALYYKTIDNRDEEEKFLNAAIHREREKKLEYPWEMRDRRLISDAFNNLGEINARTEIPGKYAEAIKYYKEAIREDETNPKAYFNLAQAYFYGERSYDLARRNYEKARSLRYGSNDLDYNLGLIYFYGREFEPALRQWTTLSEMYPDNPNIGFARGTLFLLLKRYQSALGEFLWLSEFYEHLIKGLGQIKYYNPYHRILLLNCASTYNNMGVAYQKLYETTGNREYQKDALVSLYRGGELVDLLGEERGKIQFNIQYIIHPRVIRSDMAIDTSISDNYRFEIQ